MIRSLLCGFRIALVASAIAVIAATTSSAVTYPKEVVLGNYKFVIGGSQSRWTWYNDIKPYAGLAYNAAKSVFGGKGATKEPITVEFRTEGFGGALAYAVYQYNKIALNVGLWNKRPNNEWGATLAHETSHIMFGNYLNPARWAFGNKLPGYWTFLDESLAFYTGTCAYKAHKTMTAQEIKSEWKSWRNSLNSTLQGLGGPQRPFPSISWYGSGLYYQMEGELKKDLRNLYPCPSSMWPWNYWKYNEIMDKAFHAANQTVIWQLTAQGCFFMSEYGGQRSLWTTLDRLKAYGSTEGFGLRSADARFFFDLAFRAGYGYSANTDLIYDYLKVNGQYKLVRAYYTTAFYPDQVQQAKYDSRTKVWYALYKSNRSGEQTLMSVQYNANFLVWRFFDWMKK